MTWRGQQGYLATITSAAEHAFLVEKLFGRNYADVTYLGGRQTAPREWRWVTGPEGREDEARGRLFWTATRTARSRNGQFANWQAPAFQHGGRWGCATGLSASRSTATAFRSSAPPTATAIGKKAWQGYLVEFGG